MCDVARNAYRRVELKLVALRLKRRLFWTLAGKQKAGGWELPPHQRQGLQQKVKALFPARAFPRRADAGLGEPME